jgi:hypothetical protein
MKKPKKIIEKSTRDEKTWELYWELSGGLRETKVVSI